MYYKVQVNPSVKATYYSQLLMIQDDTDFDDHKYFPPCAIH